LHCPVNKRLNSKGAGGKFYVGVNPLNRTGS